VDVGLLDATTALLTHQASRVLAAGETPVRLGNRHPSIAPYDTFDTAGGVLVLAVGTDDQWQRFCRVAGDPGLASDPRFATNALRVQHYDHLHPLLCTLLRARPVDAWISRLRPAGVPCGGVRSIAEVLADPQLAARAMIETVNHSTLGSIRQIGLPVKLSATPGAIRLPPPALGEHTDAILKELGLRN
jgi:formyl-CoA transferase/CoA:oxalate CoA-transferase